MSAELDAAVEKALSRRRSVDISYFPVYPGGQKQFDADCQVLAKAHVLHLDAEAARKADYEKLVDEEWLRSLPESQVSYGKTILGTCLGFVFDGIDVCIYDHKPHGIAIYFNRSNTYPLLLSNPTRGQVKDLVRALGGRA